MWHEAMVSVWISSHERRTHACVPSLLIDWMQCAPAGLDGAWLVMPFLSRLCFSAWAAAGYHSHACVCCC